MRTLETFALGEMAMVRAPTTGAVAVVDAPTRAALEGLQAGGRVTALARAHAAATGGGLREATAWIGQLRRAWRDLDRAARWRPPELAPAEPHPPALDAICRVGAAPVRLRVWPPRLARILGAVTAPCHDAGAVPGGRLELRRGGGRYHLFGDGVHLHTTDDLMIARSETLRRLVLASHPARHWLAILHAAGVAGPAGAALLCGCSGAGKSTLTAQLLASGLDLVTDDYAPIEVGTRLLWPVPFGLSIKEGSWPLLGPHFPELARAPVIRTRLRRQRYVAPPSQAGRPQPVSALVFPLYQPGATPALTRLDPGEALQLLARSGGWYESSPDRLAALVEWIGGVPAYALSYGDGAVAVATVRRLLGA